MERLHRILNRPNAQGYSEEGKLCYGTPVTEEEWPSLPNRSRAILVESYDDETKTAGKVVEAFFVKKERGGRAEKYMPKNITAEKPRRQQKDGVIEAKGVLLIVIDEKIHRVMVFSKEDLDLLHNKGLNSGTHLALDQQDEQGRYTVVRLEGRECKTVGLFKPLQ